MDSLWDDEIPLFLDPPAIVIIHVLLSSQTSAERMGRSILIIFQMIFFLILNQCINAKNDPFHLESICQKFKLNKVSFRVKPVNWAPLVKFDVIRYMTSRPLCKTGLAMRYEVSDTGWEKEAYLVKKIAVF